MDGLVYRLRYHLVLWVRKLLEGAFLLCERSVLRCNVDGGIVMLSWVGGALAIDERNLAIMIALTRGQDTLELDDIQGTEAVPRQTC